MAKIGSKNDQKKRSLKDIVKKGGAEGNLGIQPPNLANMDDEDMINPLAGAFASLSRGNSTISQNQAVICPGG